MADISETARGLLEALQPQACIEYLSQYDTSQNLELLELSSQAHLEAGNPSKAFELLMACVRLDPRGEKGFDKFFWLGQLTAGQESLEWYEKGLSGLRNTPDSRDKIVEALLSVIEVWMTDLCMEPGAEEKCEELVTEALMLNDENPETWTALGSIRISQQRFEDARQALLRSMELFASSIEGVSEMGVQTLLKLAQGMLELKMLQEVLEVTKMIEHIDDEVYEAYYLNGLAHFNLIDETHTLLARQRNRHVVGVKDAWGFLISRYESHHADVHDQFDESMIRDLREKLAALPVVGPDDYSSSDDEDTARTIQQVWHKPDE